MSNQVVLVTKSGEQIGVEDKISAHQKGLLHLAFSVMIYRDTPAGKEYLLQQRALSKYHSGGLWTNTCCSHPFPGEPFQLAAARRLYDELGIVGALNMTLQDSFYYRAELDNDLIEHEIDQGILSSRQLIYPPNQDEVMDWRWWSQMRSMKPCSKIRVIYCLVSQVFSYCN